MCVALLRIASVCAGYYCNVDKSRIYFCIYIPTGMFNIKKNTYLLHALEIHGVQITFWSGSLKEGLYLEDRIVGKRWVLSFSSYERTLTF